VFLVYNTACNSLRRRHAFPLTIEWSENSRFILIPELGERCTALTNPFKSRKKTKERGGRYTS